jgi:hypothetical protein
MSVKHVSAGTKQARRQLRVRMAISGMENTEITAQITLTLPMTILIVHIHHPRSSPKPPN